LAQFLRRDAEGAHRHVDLPDDTEHLLQGERCPLDPLTFTRDRRQSSSEDKMLIRASILIFASQLVIAIAADDVPDFNIARECRVDSNTAFDPNAGLNATIKRCMDDEQKAKDDLQAQWSGFKGADRVMCMRLAVGDKSDDDATPPSYVDLLTCLQDQQSARKLPKD
jgi:hypothetical protein